MLNKIKNTSLRTRIIAGTATLVLVVGAIAAVQLGQSSQANHVTDPVDIINVENIQARINAASPGDIIRVTSGDYSSQGRLTVSNSITLICDGKCDIKGMTISANGATVEGFSSINNNSNTGAFHISGNDNILKRNLADGSCMAGIIVTGTNNLIEANEVMRSRQCFGLTTGPDADGIRILNSNNIIRNNYIHSISKAENPSAHIDGIQGDYGSYPFKNILIEGNIIDVADAGVQTDGNNCDNVTIRGNTIRGARLLNMSCDNVKVTDNIFHGLPNSSFISIRPGSSNVTFTGNTVCNTTDGIIVPSGVVTTGGGNTFWNNLGIARRDSGYSYSNDTLNWPSDQWQTVNPPECSAAFPIPTNSNTTGAQ